MIGMIVAMAMVVRMITGVGTALTGRVGRHSTTGLAVVAAASLLVAEFDKGVGRGHPHLGGQRGVVRHPVGNEGPRVWLQPRFLTWLWHNSNVRRRPELVHSDPPRR
jgi:hypothetical protein